MRFVGLILVGGILCLGCSSMRSMVKQPSVELSSIDFRDPSFSAATLVVGLRVDNPNDFSIPVGNLSYALRLNGADFASGNVDKPGPLPAKGVKVVEIPVRVPYASLLKAVKSTSESGKLKYEVRGDVSTWAGSHPFTSEGSVDLPRELGGVPFH